MAYVSVKGGQEAIKKAIELTKAFRLRSPEIVLDTEAVQLRLRLLIDRIMSEGGMYSPEYAAIALKQAEGDPSEAAFLLRAYRSTLPRIGYSFTSDMASMRVMRRISSSFRDIPGGQVLGPTYDYTHRLLDFALSNENSASQTDFYREFLASYGVTTEDAAATESADTGNDLTFGKVSDLLRKEGLMAKLGEGAAEVEPFDMTREKLTFPTSRSGRLQALARGETGAMTALAYSSMRGYGVVHPTIGELRYGFVPVTMPYPYDGQADDPDEAIYLGEVAVTEVESINSFTQDKESGQIQFLLGYGLCYGQNELKAISMSILERSLETKGKSPAQDEEFVLLHIDSVESAGFVSHLKLPHYITFQSSLDRIRRTRERSNGGQQAAHQQEGAVGHDGKPKQEIPV